MTEIVTNIVISILVLYSWFYIIFQGIGEMEQKQENSREKEMSNTFKQYKWGDSYLKKGIFVWLVDLFISIVTSNKTLLWEVLAFNYATLFKVAPYWKHLLLDRLDEVGSVLRSEEQIDSFKQQKKIYY